MEVHLPCGLVIRQPGSSPWAGFWAACQHLLRLPWTPACFDNRKASDSGLQGPGFHFLGCEVSQMGQCWLQCLSQGLSWEASVKHDLGQLVPWQVPSHRWASKSLCLFREGPSPHILSSTSVRDGRLISVERVAGFKIGGTFFFFNFILFLNVT